MHLVYKKIFGLSDSKKIHLNIDGYIAFLTFKQNMILEPILTRVAEIVQISPLILVKSLDFGQGLVAHFVFIVPCCNCGHATRTENR